MCVCVCRCPLDLPGEETDGGLPVPDERHTHTQTHPQADGRGDVCEYVGWVPGGEGAEAGECVCVFLIAAVAWDRDDGGDRADTLEGGGCVCACVCLCVCVCCC